VHAEDAPLVIGHHSALSGTNQQLGVNMKLGIDLAFKEKNEAGGIRGRQLVLEFRDDAYDPASAEMAARSLMDVQVQDGVVPICPTTMMNPPVAPAVSNSALRRGPNAVLAIIGNVGTPTMVRAAPIVIETGTVFFGAFTGAENTLRDTRAGDCKKYIFNVRASYAQEARSTLEFFLRRQVGGAAKDYRNIISFDQNDSFGQAGYDGIVRAYKEVVEAAGGMMLPAGNTPIARFRYTRNDDTSVPAQAVLAEAYIKTLLQQQSGTVNVGIFMTDTYGAATEFITHLRNWQHANDSDQTSLQKATRLKLWFSNVSFVGPNALADRLVAAGTYTVFGTSQQVAYADGVVVSQVVPNYQSDVSDVVVKYNQLVAAAGRQPGFTSLEGYISARIFIAGLEKHKGPFTPESLVADYEALGDLGLGLGAASGFKPNVEMPYAHGHQYLQSVWGTQIQANGTFRNLYFWAGVLPGGTFSFFE
jgi:ABC-type branched-subunit amino acid transport system substrate-binding protein